MAYLKTDSQKKNKRKRKEDEKKGAIYARIKEIRKEQPNHRKHIESEES